MDGGRPRRPRLRLRDPLPGRATAPRQRARPATSRSGPAAAAIAASPTRVASMIQFVSQVLPRSGENACSQRGHSVSVRDHGVTDADRLPVERVAALEDADAARERADDGWVEQSRPPAVGPVDRPQARLEVEEAERHPDEPAGEVGPELVRVAEPVEDRPGRRSSTRTRSTRRSRRATPSASGSAASHDPIQKSKSRSLEDSVACSIAIPPCRGPCDASGRFRADLRPLSLR